MNKKPVIRPFREMPRTKNLISIISPEGGGSPLIRATTFPNRRKRIFIHYKKPPQWITKAIERIELLRDLSTEEIEKAKEHYRELHQRVDGLTYRQIKQSTLAGFLEIRKNRSQLASTQIRKQMQKYDEQLSRQLQEIFGDEHIFIYWNYNNNGTIKFEINTQLLHLFHYAKKHNLI